MQHEKKTAIIFDDHTMFNDSLSMLLERLNLFSEVYASNNETEIRKLLLAKHSARVFFFTDYVVPGANVTHLITDTKRLYRKTRIIVVSGTNSTHTMKQILALRPDAFITKMMGISEIMEAIDAIDQNSIYISPYITDILTQTADVAEEEPVFTPKEIEVLNHIAKGNSTQEIADIMYLSRHTIIAHRRNMMAKAKCNSVVALLYYARENKIIAY